MAGRITALEKTLICLFTAIIKQADGVNYYWVDDDGVYMPEYTTKTPDRINTELLRTMPQKMHTQELLHRPIKSMPVMTIKLKAR